MRKNGYDDNLTDHSILQRVMSWGYYLLPKAHPDCPGYTGLIVTIWRTPTELHYDPETLRLRLCNGQNAVNREILNFKSPFSEARRVSPGRVVLCDRKGKTVHFFGFGGVLSAESVAKGRIYSLGSPAPVLEITDPIDDVSDQLAIEVEALLARCRASWAGQDREFAEHLAQLEPMLFYEASLQTLLRRYEHHRLLRKMRPEFYRMMVKEKEWLRETGRWRSGLPPLPELLAPQPSQENWR